MRDGGENIASMGSCPLDAISVIYATLSGFGINIKPLQIVIKVDRPCTEIPSKKSGVCGEYCCDIYMAFLGERQGNPRKPFMKVGNNSALLFSEDILWAISTR